MSEDCRGEVSCCGPYVNILVIVWGWTSFLGATRNITPIGIVSVTCRNNQIGKFDEVENKVTTAQSPYVYSNKRDKIMFMGLSSVIHKNAN